MIMIIYPNVVVVVVFLSFFLSRSQRDAMTHAIETYNTMRCALHCIVVVILFSSVQSMLSTLIPSFFHTIGTPRTTTGSRNGTGSTGFVSVPIPIQRRMVIGIPLRPEQIPEHASQISNIGLGLEFERTAIGQIFGELGGTSLAERGDRNGLFLFHNEFVFLRGGFGLESLPWKSTLEEIDKDVPNRLEVVPTGLFDPQVIVDGRIPRSSRQGSSFPLRNMLESSGMAVPLGESEIDTVNEIAVSTTPVRDEIGGFDIAMDQMTGMHQFDAFEHLIGNHENRLERKSTSALVELIFEGRTEQIHDHEVIGILGTEIMDLGKAGCVLQFAVDLVFVTQLRTPGSVFFKLDGDLFAIGTDAEVNVPKGTSSDAFRDAVFRY